MTEAITGLELRSLIKASGDLEVALVPVEIPQPGPDEVVVRVDGHAMIPVDYVTAGVQTLQATGADNVGGIMAAEGTDDFERAVARAMTDMAHAAMEQAKAIDDHTAASRESRERMSDAVAEIRATLARHDAQHAEILAALDGALRVNHAQSVDTAEIVVFFSVRPAARIVVVLAMPMTRMPARSTSPTVRAFDSAVAM